MSASRFRLFFPFFLKNDENTIDHMTRFYDFYLYIGRKLMWSKYIFDDEISVDILEPKLAWNMLNLDFVN